MRLIDADALQMEPDENGMMNGVKFNMASRLKNRRYAIGLLKTMIDNAPTVDAVEVVRCKDCNYYTHGVCWNENITCNCDCDLEKEPNGYCDWGERRGGD